jgi:hypothetical protein
MELEKNTKINCFQTQGFGSSFVWGNREGIEGDGSPQELK